MTSDLTPEEIVEKLSHITKTSPTDAMDEALRLKIWTPGTAWHHEYALIYCAQLAVDLGEYRLAGLAAYRAQRLHLDAQNQPGMRALPELPGLEVAARRFNLIRYTPVFSRNIQLRRPRVSDRDFLLELFRDTSFCRLYSRPAMGYEEGVVHRLIKGDQRCPTTDDPWAWVIGDTKGTPIGLVELHDLDFYQQSADFSMGFRSPQFSTLAGEALCLGLTIAFYHLGLERVTHHIYGDHYLMHKLHHRMGSVKEYTLEGLVNDPESGELAAMTIYSMTVEEARNSAWLTQLQRFCPSIPDLLSNQIEKISQEILTLGPRWEIFPPHILPRIPDPPTQVAAPSVEMPKLPARIEGRRITLRPAVSADVANIAGWVETAGFIQAFPGDHKTLMRIGAEPTRNRPDIPLWLVERNQGQRTIGLVSLEIRNSLPVLFVWAGFTAEASRRDIAKSWRLLRDAIARHCPHAKVYIKLSADSSLCLTLENNPHFHHCGIERQQRYVGVQDPVSLAVLEHTTPIALCNAAE